MILIHRYAPKTLKLSVCLHVCPPPRRSGRSQEFGYSTDATAEAIWSATAAAAAPPIPTVSSAPPLAASTTCAPPAASKLAWAQAASAKKPSGTVPLPMGSTDCVVTFPSVVKGVVLWKPDTRPSRTSRLQGLSLIL